MESYFLLLFYFIWHKFFTRHLFVTELLNFYKFPGDEIPIVQGSALSALQGTNEEIGKNAILKLMDAVDEYIPDPVRQLDKPFLMPIEDVFSIQVKKGHLAYFVWIICSQELTAWLQQAFSVLFVVLGFHFLSLSLKLFPNLK